jgi:hypothetical protein
MLEPVSVGLKFGFLAVLYLFLLWIARSALKDLRRGPGGAVESDERPPPDATGMYAAVDGLAEFGGDFEPRLLVERAPGHEFKLEDPFASSRHARISTEGQVVVIEDLGSTNGTYLNDKPLTGPQPLHKGDRIRIGDSEFSYLH